MKARLSWGVVCAVVVLLVALGAAFALGSQSAGSATGLSLGVFQRSQVAADELPADALFGTQAPLDPSSTRLVADTGQAKVYVAEEQTGNVCVIVRAPGPAGQSSGCTTPETVATSAGWLRVDTPALDGSFQMAVYAVVPNGFDTAQVGDRLVKVDDNVAIFTPGKQEPSLVLSGPAGTRTVSLGDPPARQG